MHLFISACLDNKIHNYIKTFLTWGDVFDIKFELKVTKLPDCGMPKCFLTNVLHFSAGGDDNANYGNRIPAVFIQNRGLDNSYIQIASAVSGDKNHMVHVQFFVGRKYNIHIRQYKDAGQHYYEVKVNGATFDNRVNTKPTRFQNVKFYLSNPWTTSFAAEWGNVCNVHIRSHE